MYKVTGKTFDHRDYLKSIGGRWDNDEKCWIIRKLFDRDRQKLSSLVGVILTDNDSNDVEFEYEEEITTWSISDNKPSYNNETKSIVGDDERYLNYFRDQNPTAFFGFSNLQNFVDYVENLKRPGSGRDDGWHVEKRNNWYGSPDLPSAIKIAREGWFEALEQLHDIDIPTSQRKRRKKSLVGGSVSVGRMLSGDPRHMNLRPKQPGRKIYTLFVETFMSSAISTKNAINRAIIIATIVDIMEKNDYSCEIVAVLTTSGINHKTGHQAAITLKNSGEKLNLLDIVFALGHPSFFRRLIFAAVGANDCCQSTWLTQGSPTTAFDNNHKCKKNEFYIKKLSMNDQSLITNDPLSMIKFIKPDGLPIDF